jgi:hypothetical protein
VLADPVAHDVRTLAAIKSLVAGHHDSHHRLVPCIPVDPTVRDRIGQIASEAYVAHYAGPGGLRISAGGLGRLLRADASPTNGELFSHLFFAPEFADALLSEGAADASTWLSRRHDDGIWQHGRLQPERRRGRRPRATRPPGVRRSAAATAS